MPTRCLPSAYLVSTVDIQGIRKIDKLPVFFVAKMDGRRVPVYIMTDRGIGGGKMTARKGMLAVALAMAFFFRCSSPGPRAADRSGKR